MDKKQLDERKQLRDRIEAREVVFSEQESVLIDELRLHGYQVESVWDLFNRKNPVDKDEPLPNLDAAVPVLMQHLHQAYHPKVKEGIARALTGEKSLALFSNIKSELHSLLENYDGRLESAFNMLWPRLSSSYEQEELRRLTFSWMNSYQFSLCHAIAPCISKANKGEILSLVLDKRLGMGNRIILAKHLRKRMKSWKEDLEELESIINVLQIACDASEIGS